MKKKLTSNKKGIDLQQKIKQEKESNNNMKGMEQAKRNQLTRHKKKLKFHNITKF